MSTRIEDIFPYLAVPLFHKRGGQFFFEVSIRVGSKARFHLQFA